MSLPRLLSLLSVFLLAVSGNAQDADSKTTSSTAKLDRAGDPLPAGALARLGTTRFRHRGGVQFVAYAADGRMLVTVSSDGMLRLADAHTGKEAYQYKLKQNMARSMFRQSAPSILLSGDGKTLVLGVDDGECSVIEVATGKTLREFKVHNKPMERFRESAVHGQLSSDGKMLVLVDGADFGRGRGDLGKKISVWDTTTGKPVNDLLPKGKGGFAAAALSGDGKTLVALEESQPGEKGKREDDVPPLQFRFLNVLTGQELRTAPCPLVLFTDLQFTADNKGLLARTSQSSAVFHFDAGTGKEVRQYPAKQGQVRHSILAADGKTLFVLGAAQLTQYSLETGKDVRDIPVATPPVDDLQRLRFGRSEARVSLAVSPDGKTLALPVQAAVAFYDVATGKETQFVQGHRDRLDSVSFGPDNRQVLTGSADGNLFLWDASDGRHVRAFSYKAMPAEDDGLRGGRSMTMALFRVRGAFSPDGKSVAGLRWTDKLHVWDAATGALRHHLGEARGHTGFAYSPDGKQIALAASDGLIRVFDAHSGRPLRSYGTPPKVQSMPEFGDFMGMFSTAFSPDGRMVFSAGVHLDGPSMRAQVRFYEVASGKERMQFETNLTEAEMMSFDSAMSALDSFVDSFRFAPDGKTVAEAGFTTIKLRSVRSGQELRTFGGRQVVASSAVFAPDGKMLLAGKHDGAIRLWDVETGTVLLDFPAHQGTVTSLSFSKDGKLLASGARDTTALIWEWDHLRKAALKKTAALVVQPALLWPALASPEAGKAYEAMQTLANSPAETVSYLKTQLRPVPTVDPGHLKQLVDDMDDPSYAKRQKAEQALEKLGDVAAKILTDRLEGSPTLEMSRRLDRLITKLESQVVSAETLQILRAVEVLEMIDTSASRQVLDTLAKGAPGHRVTESARLSYQRLPKAPAGP